jgi:glycine cleavage system H protein
LPKPGAKLNAGESLGTVESVKAISDIYAPVSGEIAEVNSGLTETPETINKDPHGKGWLIKLRLANPAELSKLMNGAAYEAFIADKQKEASAP